MHRERPFFDSLTDFMSSGPVVVSVLEGENAVARYRELMGATNPAQADEGTIRKLFALDVEKNSVHGSDGQDTAAVEIAFFLQLIGTGGIMSVRLGCIGCGNMGGAILRGMAGKEGVILGATDVDQAKLDTLARECGACGQLPLRAIWPRIRTTCCWP